MIGPDDTHIGPPSDTPSPPSPVVYVGVGNSDNKLTQQEWSAFLLDLTDLVDRYRTEMMGWWYSSPTAPWQNACVAFRFNPRRRIDLRAELTALREQYRQDSVAWAEVPVTEFL